MHPPSVEVSVPEEAFPHDKHHLPVMKVLLGTAQMGVILTRDLQLHAVFHQTVGAMLILEVHRPAIWRMYAHLTAIHQSF